MALDLTGLTNYVKENEQQLATSLVFKPKTAQLIEGAGNVMVGVKSSEKINIMETNAVFQAGGTCGFSSSGTTAFTQRSVAPGKIKVNESICPKAFEAKYTQKALRAGSYYDYMPFADEYSAKKIEVIGAALETALWQGDTASSNAQLARFDGLLKLIAPSGTPVTGVVVASWFLGTIRVKCVTSLSKALGIVPSSDIYPVKFACAASDSEYEFALESTQIV